MNVRFTRRASVDLLTILTDLTAKDRRAALRLSQQIEQVVVRLGDFPHAYQPVEERPAVRRVPLTRFPYLLFYRVMRDGVEILRIVHGARRDPMEDL